MIFIRPPRRCRVIVDIHTHVGEYPAHISERFAAEAREAWPEVKLGGTLDEHYRDALADVDRAVVLAFNAPAAGFVVPNDYVADVRRARPGAAGRLRRRRPARPRARSTSSSG